MQYQNDDLSKNKSKYKLFGSYFIEAGLVTSNQITEALIEQQNQYPHKKIGEILVIRGWLRPTTLDYFVKKIIEPEREEQRKQNNSLIGQNHKNNQSVAHINNLDLDTKSQEKTQDILALNLDPEKVGKFLLFIIVVLVFSHILAHFGVFILNQYSDIGYSGRLFNLNEESNIPTFYSAFNLALCSILLAIIAGKKQINNSRYTKHWQFLSLLFFLLAIDEIAMIHEILTILRKPLNASGFFYFTWVVPAIIFLIILSFVFISFLKSLPKRIRTLFIFSGIIYVVGAIGVEMVSGYHSEIYGENNFAYGIITTVEELLEMMGILAFIYSLLFYLQNYLGGINLFLSFKKKLSR